jgi:hypothetical protein
MASKELGSNSHNGTSVILQAPGKHDEIMGDIPDVEGDGV